MDSLCYEIQTEDFYRDISKDVERLFDTSNYPKDHPSKILTGKNKKVIGMFKDEAGGKIILGFVGLRAKLYAYRMLDGKEEKKCKGIRKPVIKKDTSFEDYITKITKLSTSPQEISNAISIFVKSCDQNVSRLFVFVIWNF